MWLQVLQRQIQVGLGTRGEGQKGTMIVAGTCSALGPSSEDVFHCVSWLDHRPFLDDLAPTI
jgi:hypothetical protein